MTQQPSSDAAATPEAPPSDVGAATTQVQVTPLAANLAVIGDAPQSMAQARIALRVANNDAQPVNSVLIRDARFSWPQGSTAVHFAADAPTGAPVPPGVTATLLFIGGGVTVDACAGGQPTMTTASFTVVIGDATWLIVDFPLRVDCPR